MNHEIQQDAVAIYVLWYLPNINAGDAILSIRLSPPTRTPQQYMKKGL